MPEQPPGTPPAPAPGPLDGLTVLDFSTMMAGPHCTRMMADLGATVVKVESPDGDHMRKLRPRKSGSSRFFGQLNVGKRSVTLDLSAAAGQQAALSLVAQADIVLESWRPGVAGPRPDLRGLPRRPRGCHLLLNLRLGPVRAERPAGRLRARGARGLRVRHGQPLLPAARQHPPGHRRVRRRHPRRHHGLRRDPGRRAQAGHHRRGLAHRPVAGGGDAVHAGL